MESSLVTTHNGLALSIRVPVKVRAAGRVLHSGSGVPFEREMGDEYILVFVRQGTFNIDITDYAYSVGEGQALLVCPGQHITGCTSDSDDAVFYWANFQAACATPDCESEQIHLSGVCDVGRAGRVMVLFRMLLDDFVAHECSHESSNILLAMILCDIAESASLGDTCANPAASIVDRAMNYIRLNFFEQISTSTVAKGIGCSVGYLCHSFRTSCEVTPMEFLCSVRMQEAKRLLLETEDTVAEVARRCGFQDAGYFRRVFRRAEGLSPREYRRVHSRTYTARHL